MAYRNFGLIPLKFFRGMVFYHGSYSIGDRYFRPALPARCTRVRNNYAVRGLADHN